MRIFHHDERCYSAIENEQNKTTTKKEQLYERIHINIGRYRYILYYVKIKMKVY